MSGERKRSVRLSSELAIGTFAPSTSATRFRTTKRSTVSVAVTAASINGTYFNQATADYLDQAAPGCGHVGVGSSLKFCIVAEGRADIYPRLSPTSEWDTAAGHAVVLAAGGRVDGPDGEPLRYGKKAEIEARVKQIRVQIEEAVYFLFTWTQGTFNFEADVLKSGAPVLVDFWDYTCVNCIRTLPYVQAWHERYGGKGLTVIGVHTPEFPFEKSASNVQAALKRPGITC